MRKLLFMLMMSFADYQYENQDYASYCEECHCQQDSEDFVFILAMIVTAFRSFLMTAKGDTVVVILARGSIY